MPQKKISVSDALKEAAAEPSRRDLEDYWPAVETLRVKGLSWREVSAWLAKRGVKLHHSLLHKHSQKLATDDLVADGMVFDDPENANEEDSRE